jgi:RNA polymerase sigma-70 factor (ECF subfamily)
VREREKDRSHRLERIIEQHGAALGRLAAVYASDTDSRDDLLQEILLAIWRALSAYRGECSERTFIFRIAHNRGITHRSRQREHAPLDTAFEIADPRSDPEVRLRDSLAQEQLLDAVRKLPDSQRQVVVLHLEGFSHKEIGDVLGISENNVAVRLTRAKVVLRSLLIAEESHS